MMIALSHISLHSLPQTSYLVAFSHDLVDIIDVEFEDPVFNKPINQLRVCSKLKLNRTIVFENIFVFNRVLVKLGLLLVRYYLCLG